VYWDVSSAKDSSAQPKRLFFALMVIRSLAQRKSISVDPFISVISGKVFDCDSAVVEDLPENAELNSHTSFVSAIMNTCFRVLPWKMLCCYRGQRRTSDCFFAT